MQPYVYMHAENGVIKNRRKRVEKEIKGLSKEEEYT